MSKRGVFSGLYFPVFGLNTEIYAVNLRIQSKNSVFGHSLRSDKHHIFRKHENKSTQKLL